MFLPLLLRPLTGIADIIPWAFRHFHAASISLARGSRSLRLLLNAIVFFQRTYIRSCIPCNWKHPLRESSRCSWLRSPRQLIRKRRTWLIKYVSRTLTGTLSRPFSIYIRDKHLWAICVFQAIEILKTTELYEPHLRQHSDRGTQELISALLAVRIVSALSCLVCISLGEKREIS